MTCVPEIFDALALLVGRRKMMELTGYTRTGLDSTKERGRIRIQAASSLYKETGIDISGGEIMGRETPDEF